jgi:hypothetical protein
MKLPKIYKYEKILNNIYPQLGQGPFETIAPKIFPKTTGFKTTKVF